MTSPKDPRCHLTVHLGLFSFPISMVGESMKRFFLAASVAVLAALCGCTPSMPFSSDRVWISPVTMSAVTSDESQPYAWTGTLSGRIRIDGDVLLTASNGCVLKGTAEPKLDSWNLDLHATHCPVDSLNTDYDAKVLFVGKDLKLTASATVFRVGSTVVNELRADMPASERTASNS